MTEQIAISIEIADTAPGAAPAIRVMRVLSCGDLQLDDAETTLLKEMARTEKIIDEAKADVLGQMSALLERARAAPRQPRRG